MRFAVESRQSPRSEPTQLQGCKVVQPSTNPRRRVATSNPAAAFAVVALYALGTHTGLAVLATPAAAQLKVAATRESKREQANDGVVTIMAGRPSGEFLGVADDIAAIVNPSGSVRVLPISGDGGAQNLRDLSYLRNVDVALTHVPVLNQMAASRELGPNLDKQFVYITSLFPHELHLIARADVKSFSDLAGKRVNIGNEGSGTALVMPALLQALGVEVRPVNLGQVEALERMSRGELDATACVCSAPVPAFAAIKLETGYKLLAVPLLPVMERDYLPAKLDAPTYPNLNRKGEAVDTVAVRTVLVTFNWPVNSTRYVRIARFVEAMFGRFDELSRPPRHSRWSDVNIAAAVPGWQRLPAAQAWIDRTVQRRTAEAQKGQATAPPAAAQGQGGATGLAADNDRLFREFLDYMRDRR